MKNILKIGEYQAVIEYDPDIDMFRGEFIGLNGGADFYASTIEDLHREAEASLAVFLEMCREEGITPRKQFSGRFNLRLDPEIHRKISVAAASEGVSINQFVAEVILKAVDDDSCIFAFDPHRHASSSRKR